VTFFFGRNFHHKKEKFASFDLHGWGFLDSGAALNPLSNSWRPIHPVTHGPELRKNTISAIMEVIFILDNIVFQTTSHLAIGPFQLPVCQYVIGEFFHDFWPTHQPLMILIASKALSPTVSRVNSLHWYTFAMLSVTTDVAMIHPKYVEWTGTGTRHFTCFLCWRELLSLKIICQPCLACFVPPHSTSWNTLRKNST